MTKVCVTGASGFIASWLVKLLLERGYNVRASVRDPGNLKETAHLLKLPKANEGLQLFKADLLDEGSFDAAIEGCDGVFHTASPCFFDATDPQKELLDPAIKGTLNVLRACAKALSVKRVVLTSSVAAVLHNPTRKPEDVVDETFFSDAEHCRQSNGWYMVSKTLAEAEAWKFSKEHGLDLVTIIPAAVVGRLLQQTMNTSSEIILKLVNGAASTFPNAVWGWVGVKDVAQAHIKAYETPTASGRYLCVERVAHYEEIAGILRRLYPDYPIPTTCADENTPRAPVYKRTTQKLQGLGFKFTPLEDELRECVESLMEQGLVKRKTESCI